MSVTQSIELDVSREYLRQPIFAKQIDDGTRFLNILLKNNGVAIQPPSGSTAVFRGLKPDRHSFMNTATIENDGSVTVELTEQVLASPGFVDCDISITKNGTILSTATFAIDVRPVPMNGDTTISSNEFTYLQEQIKSSEAWAHGRDDFPERAYDNAKYWCEQASAAAGGGIIDDVTGEEYSIGVSNGRMFIRKVLT